MQRENRAAIKLIADASDANSAQLSLTYLQGVLMSYFQSMNQDMQLPWSVHVESRMFYNEELKGVYMFVPGLMAMILMLISAMMTSVTITQGEGVRDHGTSAGIAAETKGDHPGKGDPLCVSVAL